MYAEQKKCKHKQTGNVIQYSIGIKAVPLNREEKQNKERIK